MQLVRPNPFRQLQRVERDMQKLWESGWGLLPTFAETSALDLYEENGKLVAEVHLPNFSKEEVKVTTEEGVLEISAQHKEEKEEKEARRYFFHESSNQYFRRVTLPENALTDQAEASFEGGTLKVTMPMSESKRSTEIPVQ